MMRTPPIKPAAAVLAGALTLGACSTFSPDGGLSVAANIADQELHKDVVAIRTQDDTSSARARAQHLLKRPLTADSAVQIALLNNRGLQAAYNELGIAESVRARQSLPPNPSFSISRISGSVETEIDRQIVGNIFALATLPMRTEIAADRFRQAQLVAALETLRIAAETRQAFYRAVAARQQVELLTQASSAAATTTQLAKRLGETGAMNKLDQAREQVFYADLTTQLASARQRATGAREELIRSLGLWGADLAFTLPNSLPTLPKRPRTLPAAEQEAVSRRVDLQIARIELDTLAKSYGLTQATRFINVLDAGYADKVTTSKGTGEQIRDRGFTVTFEVPLFDFGETRLREAEQTYMQAVNRLAEKAINVRSEARDRYQNYRSTYDIAAHYQREVLPLRKIISDEMMLRYGAMQVDVFPLLTEARQRIAANAAAVEAQRNFWLANTDLSTAIIGGGAGTNNQETSNMTTPPAGDATSH
jgi:outer membrane protein TolC